MNVTARLAASDTPLVSESVSIENISSHGARVLTNRSWKPRERVTLTEMAGHFHVEAEVVYTQRLNPGLCAIGLKFTRPVGDTTR